MREHAYGSFQRSFQLPVVIGQEQVTVSFKHGLLELRLPKSEAAKPAPASAANVRWPPVAPSDEAPQPAANVRLPAW